MLISCLIKKLNYQFIEPCLDVLMNRKMISRNEWEDHPWFSFEYFASV